MSIYPPAPLLFHQEEQPAQEDGLPSHVEQNLRCRDIVSVIQVCRHREERSSVIQVCRHREERSSVIQVCRHREERSDAAIS
jgi:hypothetical protein